MGPLGGLSRIDRVGTSGCAIRLRPGGVHHNVLVLCGRGRGADSRRRLLGQSHIRIPAEVQGRVALTVHHGDSGIGQGGERRRRRRLLLQLSPVYSRCGGIGGHRGGRIVHQPELRAHNGDESRRGLRRFVPEVPHQHGIAAALGIGGLRPPLSRGGPGEHHGQHLHRGDRDQLRHGRGGGHRRHLRGDRPPARTHT